MIALPTGSAPLALTLFGPLHVRVHNQPLPHLRSRKTLWLLALLTLRHDRSVERDWLAGTLWPDVAQSQAFANLRPTLSELRKALGSEGARLQTPDRQTILFDLRGAEADVLAFDAAIASGQLAALEQAVSLYRGPLLEGCTEEWVFQERSVREQQCSQALQKLAEAAMAASDAVEAIRYYQQAVRLDPWWDTARRGLIEAYAKHGDKNAALQVYREFVELLRSDPSATPDEQTRALYARLRSETRGSGETVASVNAVEKRERIGTGVTGYLPHPLTELVGREDERREVAAKLHRSRLVTLTGLGGIGKTRLSLQVATEVAEEYEAGVWLVALETATEGKQVVSQIASVLGVREESGRSLLSSVSGWIGSRRLLLVLDNCEHLLAASAGVVEPLLRECANLRILATSREALGITGETVWTVPSMAVPDLKHLPKNPSTLLQVLSGYESVQLFVERAQAVQKTFTLTSGNARAVATICAQLEGIPLALELAAARIRALTVEQIVARLDDELGLLTMGNRMALSRQQTLRAALDWSYALLSEPERLLLHRLSVFAGGWTLEAAEGVGGGEGLETEQILDELSSLVDKSLVAFEEREETGGRYRLLEMVRQYAAERLSESEAAQVRRRHRDWYLALAETAEPQLTGSEQGWWLGCLEREHGNLRSALDWSAVEGANGSAKEAEAGLRLAGALYRFWYVRGYWSEGREYLSRMLLSESAQTRTAARAKALYGAGALAYSQADYVSAQALNEESLSLFREQNDRHGIAESLSSLGKVAYDQGDYASAQALNEESLSLFRELDDRYGMAWALNSLGNIAHPQGKYKTAQALYEASLNLFRELGDRTGVARSLNCLGYVAFDQGEFASARDLYEESLSIFQELEDRGGIAWSNCCLGYVAYDQGDYVSAQAHLGQGLKFFRELGDRRGVAWSLNSLGNVAYDLGDYDSARSLHEESLNLRRELGDRQGIAWSVICQGNVACQQGDYTAAWELLGEGLCLFQELEDRKGVAESLERLAAVMQAQTETRKAVRLWAAAQALRESIGAPSSSKAQAKLDQQVTQACSILGESDYAAVREEGRALSWERAIAYALESRPHVG